MRQPDFKGPCGSAWRVTLPSQHVIHLRDIPGVRPAMKHMVLGRAA